MSDRSNPLDSEQKTNITIALIIVAAALVFTAMVMESCNRTETRVLKCIETGKSPEDCRRAFH